MRTLLWLAAALLTGGSLEASAQTVQAPDPNLVLTPGAPPPPPPTADPNIRWSQDAVISASLFRKLNTGPYGAQISVDTERGQVLLRGLVPSAAAAAQAEALARQEPGVVGVRNALAIQPGAPPAAPNMLQGEGATITPPVLTPQTQDSR